LSEIHTSTREKQEMNIELWLENPKAADSSQNLRVNQTGVLVWTLNK